MEKNDIYRMIPRVDSLMADPMLGEMIENYGYDRELQGVRITLENVRKRLEACSSASDAKEELEGLHEKI